MKKNEVPQDKTFLRDISREVCYVKNEEGKYDVALSTGWKVKHEALIEAWEDIRQRVEEARTLVLKGEKSPVFFFMEYRLMDMSLLASYTGFWRWKVKRHMNPKHFRKLSKRKLEVYANVFDIEIEDLTNFNASHSKYIYTYEDKL